MEKGLRSFYIKETESEGSKIWLCEFWRNF